MSDAVQKYRRRWASPESSLAAEVVEVPGWVLVVPAFCESATFLDGYAEASAAASGRVLAIVVVNAPVGASAQAFTANQELLADLRVRINATSGDGFLLGSVGDLDVLVVDRTSVGRELPVDQGVGLARRIGCDIALELHTRGKLRNPWIALTDADALLPSDYFAQLSDLPRTDVAATFDFEHVPCGDPRIDGPTMLYEQGLRYHLLGLASAGSPYAFHSVGSSLAVRPEPYAMVHGMPQRLAGEDFYLLNKLAKLGPISRLREGRVQIRSRRSDRTPFGTGRAVQKLWAGGTLSVASPDAFAALGTWLSLLNEFALDRDVGVVEREVEDGCLSPMATFLDSLHYRHQLALASAQAPSASALRTRLHVWFDGFRTLKFLHAARDHAPDRDVDSALKGAWFAGASAGASSEDLRELEHQLVPRVGPTLPNPAFGSLDPNSGA